MRIGISFADAGGAVIWERLIINISLSHCTLHRLDEEHQSKESIETYDDYSTEDDGKPTRLNSKRKPLNSSRVEATAPTLQLFDLALVDIAKPEDVAKNRTRKAAFEKVSTGNVMSSV